MDYRCDDEMLREMRQGTGSVHRRYRKIQISFLQKLPLSRVLCNSSLFQGFSRDIGTVRVTKKKKLQFSSRQRDQTV